MHDNQTHIAVSRNVAMVGGAVSDDRRTVGLPNVIYLFDDFKRLAAEHTFIFYDLRNRRRSEEASPALSQAAGTRAT